ncbi:ATP-binding protein [Flectobacillus major]|uniref:ATP-binding protein n=1 Tax=Flectobacillus major TaxID=103 RepID=UPI000419F032|nr:ATP-binding protein [Flectobacillus major]
MMQEEGKNIDYKSIRKIQQGDSGFKDLAVSVVCFANAQGGKLIIGIEDKNKTPLPDQKVSIDEINKTLNRLRSLTFNVGLMASDIIEHPEGGQYFEITVLPSSKAIATTSDGKIFLRVGDQCHAARSEDIVRIATEKDAFQWELQLRNVSIGDIPIKHIAQFAQDIRLSSRVKESVKELSDNEIIEHYNLSQNGQLTNLGILWLGIAQQRSRLAYPLTVQYIVYNDLEEKVRKIDWHDYALNPKELLQAIEKEAIELTYFHEFNDGLFQRKPIRFYHEKVIRELLINAFAHKSYTISGDIFIKVFTDRLEIKNPGGLLMGITKDNILHKTARRNPHLIKIFHDLNLMEGEGSGYDLMYEISSRNAKPFPTIEAEYDSVNVIQESKILDEDTVALLEYVSNHYQLSQREFIALGIISRSQKILTTQLYRELQLPEEERLRTYVNRLLEQGLIISRGLKKGTEYLINPHLIANAKLNVKASLKVIEQHRLKALIIEELRLRPESSIDEIHKRFGEIDRKDIQKAIYKLVDEGEVEYIGGKTYRKYFVAKKKRK